MQRPKILILLIIYSWLTSNLHAQPLSLEEALDIAKKNNPELKIAHLQLERIENKIPLTKTNMHPKINLTADQTKQNAFETQFINTLSGIDSKLVSLERKRHDLGVRLDQKLIDFTHGPNLESVKLNFEAGLSNLNQLEKDLLLEVALTYYDTIKLKSLTDIILNNLKILVTYLTDSKIKLNYKFEEKQKIINIRINIQNIKQELLNTNQKYLTQKIKLNQLLGMPAEKDLEFPALSIPEFYKIKKWKPFINNNNFYNFSTQSIYEKFWETKNDQAYLKTNNINADLPDEPISSKEDNIYYEYNSSEKFDYDLEPLSDFYKIWKNSHKLHQLFKYKESISKQKQSIQNGYLPTVNLQGLFGYLNEDRFRTDHEDEYWAITFRANLNIFDGFEKKYQIKETDIKIREAEEQIKQTKNELKLQLEEAVYNLKLAEETYKISKDIMREAKENLAMMNEKFKFRQITKEDLIAPKLAFNDSKSNYIKAQIDLLIAEEKYKYLVGEKYDEYSMPDVRL